MDELLATRESSIGTPDWSPDRRFIVFGASGPGTDRAFCILPMTAERKPLLFLKTPAQRKQRDILARRSMDRLRVERVGPTARFTFVRFPVKEGVFPISRDGGWSPRWRERREGAVFPVTGRGSLCQPLIRESRGLFAAAASKAAVFDDGLQPGKDGRPLRRRRETVSASSCRSRTEPAGGNELTVIDEFVGDARQIAAARASRLIARLPE